MKINCIYKITKLPLVFLMTQEAIRMVEAVGQGAQRIII